MKIHDIILFNHYLSDWIRMPFGFISNSTELASVQLETNSLQEQPEDESNRSEAGSDDTIKNEPSTVGGINESSTWKRKIGLSTRFLMAALESTRWFRIACGHKFNPFASFCYSLLLPFALLAAFLLFIRHVSDIIGSLMLNCRHLMCVFFLHVAVWCIVDFFKAPIQCHRTFRSTVITRN